MPISFTRYVDITSALLGAGEIGPRQLVTRLYSTNPLIPANTFASWPNAEAVGEYFGFGSTEYAISDKYFAFVSKLITSPQSIQFASWVESALAPYVYGDPLSTASLSAFVAVAAAGTLKMTLGETTQQVSIGTMASAGSLAAVAAIIQTAVRTITSDPDWASATVAYNSMLVPGGGCFTITGGSTGVGAIDILVPSSGTDVGAMLGWESALAIVSQGSAAMTLTETLAASVAASNNFGTLAFIPSLDQAQNVEVATWMSTWNVLFMYLLPVTADTAEAVSTALLNLPGCAITLSPNAGDYPELFPGIILAATNYLQQNSSQNFMFQQGNFDVTVSNDNDADTYDGLRVNYYGETQLNGQVVEFYQRGVLTGLSNSPTDMNVYANEMWFKSQVAATILNLMLALTKISANAAGRAQLIAVIQSVIVQALFNRTISVGTKLNAIQILAINNITGTTTAWQQVQTIGYWLDVQFSSSVDPDSGITTWTANYILVYKKDDVIRSVLGSHALI